MSQTSEDLKFQQPFSRPPRPPRPRPRPRPSLIYMSIYNLVCFLLPLYIFLNKHFQEQIYLLLITIMTIFMPSVPSRTRDLQRQRRPHLCPL